MPKRKWTFFCVGLALCAVWSRAGVGRPPTPVELSYEIRRGREPVMKEAEKAQLRDLGNGTMVLEYWMEGRSQPISRTLPFQFSWHWARLDKNTAPVGVRLENKIELGLNGSLAPGKFVTLSRVEVFQSGAMRFFGEFWVKQRPNSGTAGSYDTPVEIPVLQMNKYERVDSLWYPFPFEKATVVYVTCRDKPAQLISLGLVGEKAAGALKTEALLGLPSDLRLYMNRNLPQARLWRVDWHLFRLYEFKDMTPTTVLLDDPRDILLDQDLGALRECLDHNFGSYTLAVKFENNVSRDQKWKKIMAQLRQDHDLVFEGPGCVPPLTSPHDVPQDRLFLPPG